MTGNPENTLEVPPRHFAASSASSAGQAPQRPVRQPDLHLHTERKIKVPRSIGPCRIPGPELAILAADDERLHRAPLEMERADCVLKTSRTVFVVHEVDPAAQAAQHGDMRLNVELKPRSLVAYWRAKRTHRVGGGRAAEVLSDPAAAKAAE